MCSTGRHRLTSRNLPSRPDRRGESGPTQLSLLVLAGDHHLRSREDILRSYSLHTNAYVTKPVVFGRFIEAVRQIDDFLITLVKLQR